MSKIILASGSPRRKELMSLAGLEFEIKVADVDETLPSGITPFDAVKMLSLKKALAVAVDNPDKIVIGADTVVAYDGKILGKPQDEQDAFDMLKALSGNTHKVYTGVAIVCGDKVNNFFEETDVEFYPLSDDEIRTYIKTGEPMDKAGAYGIQGKGCVLVKRINGDYSNVVGLPIARLVRELNK